MKGIDVSSYQGKIDWKMVKDEAIAFVILRMGIGDNIFSQDDSSFLQNVKECEKYKIPYAVYLVSYAKNLKGEESVFSEIEHTERLLKGIHPFCLFYDMEVDATNQLGKETLTNYAVNYCDYFRNLGYEVGVYANRDWFVHYLDYDLLREKGYRIWLAHYGVDKPSLTCDLWQYTDKGRVKGIEDNTVDFNQMYGDFSFLMRGDTNDLSFVVQEVLEGKWGNGEERRQLLSQAGYSYEEVQRLVNEKLKGKTKILSYVVKSGDTLNEIASLFQSTSEELAVYNEIKDINRIYVGQVLKIPRTSLEQKNNYYIVKKGDTLSKIASLYQTSVIRLRDLNSILDVDKIYVGQKIRVD